MNLIARVLGGKATLTLTHVPCVVCGVRTPADVDGWDTSCAPCTADYVKQIARERRLANLRVDRYCAPCNGPHHVAAGYHIR